MSLGLLENDTAGYNWVNRVIHGQFYCQILRFEIKPDPLLTSPVPRGIWAPAILIAVAPPGWQLMMAWLSCTPCTPNRGQWHGQQSGNELEIKGVFFVMEDMEVDTGWMGSVGVESGHKLLCRPVSLKFSRCSTQVPCKWFLLGQCRKALMQLVAWEGSGVHS